MQRVTWLGVQRVAWASSPLVAPLAAKPQSASSTSSVRSGRLRAEGGVWAGMCSKGREKQCENVLISHGHAQALAHFAALAVVALTQAAHDVRDGAVLEAVGRSPAFEGVALLAQAVLNLVGCGSCLHGVSLCLVVDGCIVVHFNAQVKEFLCI